MDRGTGLDQLVHSSHVPSRCCSMKCSKAHVVAMVVICSERHQSSDSRCVSVSRCVVEWSVAKFVALIDEVWALGS